MGRSTSRAADPCGGFALLELVIALAIAAMIAAVALPRLLPMRGLADLREAATGVATVLLIDRNGAARTGAEVATTLDFSTGVVSSGMQSASIKIPDGIALELGQAGRVIREGNALIRFAPGGRSSGGVLTLRWQRAAAEVYINPLTSSVTIDASRPRAVR
ncbi:prepilin-type N-terminal cleavage/methylation domain-containing protein [Aurantimonas sp. HBX-1]|uniref:prepilin-type N-terminal cleavage/methylation domain-containing protein n=1 Tax=Aurantimonas sp. HBX-1 TaxID=2906072 RepID=UPI001F22AE5C|nr:prepilin-type N-terminal cleavage/methylation domain-containing protein [Aurantimonas sp. HBX-1]UIJ73898.1 prepilin-type N-terminal cleavage/methylation domain-containing protein [Aurantimonas sp. HBX-1]